MFTYVLQLITPYVRTSLSPETKRPRQVTKREKEGKNNNCIDSRLGWALLCFSFLYAFFYPLGHGGLHVLGGSETPKPVTFSSIITYVGREGKRKKIMPAPGERFYFNFSAAVEFYVVSRR